MNGVRAGIIIPTASLTDRVPLCSCTLIGDACQTGATGEHIIAYARDAVRDRDACQIGATEERQIA